MPVKAGYVTVPSTVQYTHITFLLSSSTVFMFSIQTASTGPSKMIHLRSSFCDEACSLNELAKTPTQTHQIRSTKHVYYVYVVT